MYVTIFRQNISELQLSTPDPFVKVEFLELKSTLPTMKNRETSAGTLGENNYQK